MFDVYDYERGCDFLRQAFEAKKMANPRFSLRQLSRKLETHPGTLSKILNGERKIPYDIIPNIGKVFELSHRELEYLETLVKSEKSKSDMARADYRQRLEELKPKERRQLEADEFAYVNKWYHSCLLEMFELKDFVPSRQNFQDRLKALVEVDQIDEALVTLKRLGLITEKNGVYRKINSINFSSALKSEAIRNYHRGMIDQGLKSIDDSIEKRHLSGTTVALEEKNYEKAIEILGQAHEKIRELSSQNADEVYHFSSQFFPLTERTL